MGCAVVVSARNVSKAEEAANKLKKQNIDAHPLALNVTSQAEIDRLPAYFQDTFGRLDIIVNNAGVLLDKTEPPTAETLRKTFETNTIAPYAITLALLPLLKASPQGRIVNQSSILGSQTANSDKDMIGTDFLTPDSLRLPGTTTDAYPALREMTRAHLQMPGTQLGDPVKAAAALIELGVAGNGGRLRHPLGSDSFSIAVGALDARRREVEAGEAVARSTDVVEA